MFEKIVAAIDSDPERSAKVIQATLEVCRARTSEVVIAHVREVERPAPMLARAGALPPALHLESEEDAQHLVERKVEELRGAGVTVRGEVGTGGASTANELLKIAEAFAANLIVVGDRGSNVSDLLLGGVAHRIVHLAHCPVLVVR